MLSLLKSILDSITTIIGLVVSIFTSLINFIVNIPTYIQFITSIIGVAPSFVYSTTIAGISITVILWLLNRQSKSTGGN